MFNFFSLFGYGADQAEGVSLFMQVPADDPVDADAAPLGEGAGHACGTPGAYLTRVLRLPGRTRPVLVAIILAVLMAAALGLAYVSSWSDRTICEAGPCPGGTRARSPVPLPPILPGRTVLPEVAPVAPDDARKLNAVAPFFRGKLAAARPFRFAGSVEDRNRAVDCLAAAQLYEAGLSEEDQKAVAQVVLNRLRHPAFPHSVCGVVFEGAERTTGCQFTFTCDGALARRYSETAWVRARQLAAKMLDGAVDPRVGWATHYHTDWVYPYWSPSLDKLSAIGTHLFFKWRGYWGTGGAFAARYVGQEPFIAKLATSGMAAAPSPEIPTETVPDSDATILRPLADAPPPNGMSVAALDGHALKMVHPDGGVYGLLLRQGAGADSMMAVALRLCFGQAFCRVMGWSAASDIPRGFPVPSKSLSALRFSYVRDPTAPRTKTQFDCNLFPRPKMEQCFQSEAASPHH
jgi:hypothetical protein